ncbi:HEAT repeat domain-containing protein [Anabaena sp. UHCC 0451]|uniref:HEAT repeat domain-containing protein n=1 Tax=Anabaena sp. UHCC 0451 TaxID=2055235 RepID=UPI002B212542|nr:HEAT repeat domain-containing protein [Anabaena sp. UHCC 0451]MEA5576416.1 HEAT repeat domain-containing protein [Anabaena sp. UHCC 0451]
MTSPKETTLQQQFLQDKSRKFEFTGDTYQVFLVRFDPNNYAIDDDDILLKKINSNKEVGHEKQKIKDILGKNIYSVFRQNGCDITSKGGRPSKGNEPWKQAYKWLWDEKYPEWLAQQQTQNNQPEPEPKTLQINWREICQKMLQKQQNEQRLRRQITELKHETEIFVELGLIQPKPARRKEEKPFPDAAEGMRQYELKTEEITKQYEYQQFIDEVIGQQTKNLAIIGEPGAGKTTWLSKIAEYLADKSDYPSPIFINLSRLDNRTLKDYLLHTWLEEALEFIPSQITVTPALEADFQQQFKDKRVWLLLDGVDEMKTTANSPLSQLNSQLEGWVTWTRVILTCRLNVWQPNPIANFEYYRTLAFSNVQVRDFIQQWYEKAEKRELGEQLQQKLTAPQHSRIFDLVKNPLRLAMLCQSWYFLQGELPETKANLYQRFVDATYEWKKGEFGTTAAQIQQLNQALGKLALRMIDEQISLKVSVIKDVMSLEDFELAERLGWLNWVYTEQKTEQRVYAFFHLSFAEYFAACVIDDWDYFLPKDHEDKPVEGKKYRIFENEWNEIFLLWMGRDKINKDKKEEFILALVNFQDGGVDDFYSFQAYFKAAIAIGEFKSCLLANRIVCQIIKWGFGYFDKETQKWVNFPDPILEEADEGLSLIDTKIIITALMSILNSIDDKNIIIKVSRSLLEIEPENERAITELMSILDSTDDINIIIEVSRSLLEIEPENERVITALMSILNSNDDENTLKKSIRSLEKIAVGNEQVITNLISILNSTENKNISRAVTRSLEKIAVGNEQAITNLISILNSTEDKSIIIEVSRSLEKIAVGNEQAIINLISILNSTENKNISRAISNILGEIAVGNEQAIINLISILNSTEDKNISRAVSNILGEIAIGNEQAITNLISILNSTHKKSIIYRTLEILEEIAVGNKEAITALISILNFTDDEDTCLQIAETLVTIEPGNEEAITALISILNSTDDEDTCLQIAETLVAIEPGNEEAITALISILNSTDDEDICMQVVETLGEIGVDDEESITALISLLNSTDDEYTIRKIARSLGKIGVYNEKAITALISLLNSTDDKDICIQIVETLGEIGVDNEESITALISILNSTDDEYTLRKVTRSLGEIGKVITALTCLLNLTKNEDICMQIVETLGEIGVDNEKTITALISLFNSTDDEYTLRKVTRDLGEIGIDDENVITALISLLNSTENEDICMQVVEILGEIIKTENNYLITISALNKHLTKEVYKNNSDLYKNYSKILWQCAKNLTYPQFYQAWHATNTTTLNQLQQQYTDIYTQLKQLQPTSTTYPIPLNAANLEGKTAEKAIAKGILIKIYGEIFPKQKAENIEDIFDLENQLQPLRKHLNTDKIALIFCDINPHPELINFCQQLQKNHWLKIALITDTPIASPLSGFSPQQDNLLGVVQTWLEESEMFERGS